MTCINEHMNMSVVCTKWQHFILVIGKFLFSVWTLLIVVRLNHVINVYFLMPIDYCPSLNQLIGALLPTAGLVWHSSQ